MVVSSLWLLPSLFGVSLLLRNPIATATATTAAAAFRTTSAPSPSSRLSFVPSSPRRRRRPATTATTTATTTTTVASTTTTSATRRMASPSPSFVDSSDDDHGGGEQGQGSRRRKVALVTGSTDGIGVTTAKHLVAKGYDVMVHGRDPRRIRAALDEITGFVGGRAGSGPKNRDPDVGAVYPLPPCDISTIRGCQDLSRHVRTTLRENRLPPRLSVLMNNAGVYEPKLRFSVDGYETTFAVNVLGTFLVTSYLLPLLLRPSQNEQQRGQRQQSSQSEAAGEEQQEQQQQQSRIVIASSISQCSSVRDWEDLPYCKKRPYSAHGAYAESKLCDAVLCVEMASRLERAGYAARRVTCNCLDPGTVNTKMLLAGWGPCGVDARDALDEAWLCASEEVRDATGRYFVAQRPRRASSPAYDAEQRRTLWNLLSRIAPDAARVWDEL